MVDSAEVGSLSTCETADNVVHQVVGFGVSNCKSARSN